MRRPHKNTDRTTEDLKYGSKKLSKFINYVMLDGKKTLATNLVYNALDKIKEQGLDPMETFDKAIENSSPELEVKSRRVGGANYQIPIPVKEERQFTLASRWIISSVRSKTGKDFDKILADVLIEASKGEGDAVKKKEDTHRMADANKAFAHYAW